MTHLLLALVLPHAFVLPPKVARVPALSQKCTADRAGREAERRDGAARRLEESHLEGGKRTAVSIEKV